MMNVVPSNCKRRFGLQDIHQQLEFGGFQKWRRCFKLRDFIYTTYIWTNSCLSTIFSTSCVK